MQKCELRWVDDSGKPTPDDNPAVTTAVHTLIYPSGETIVRRFGCCAKHAEHLDAMVRLGLMVSDYDGRTLYTSQWTREVQRPE